MNQSKQFGTPIRPTGTTSADSSSQAAKPIVWRLSQETAKAIASVERNSREALRTALKRLER